MKLKRDFFVKNTLLVAKNLLGKIIVRKFNNQLIKGKIVETEAYIGPWDLASHARFSKQSEKEKLKILDKLYPKIKNKIENWNLFKKRVLSLEIKITERNIAEFLTGGHIYIYLIYGKYFQLNITTYKEGYPECVLLRALEPITKSKIIPNGPGKLCQYLKLDKSFLFEDLTSSKRIWIEDSKIPYKVVCAKRIGIEYAKGDKLLPWRFYIKDNKFVSKQ